MKIAVIASSIHPVRQKHLLDWYFDLSSEAIKFQLFLGSKNTHIPSATNYKINSKWSTLGFFPWIYFFRTNSDLRKIHPLVKYNPNIIHLLTSNQFENIEPLLEYNKKIKLIVSFRGFDLYALPHENESNLESLRRLFDKAHILHFISEGLRDMAIALGADISKCVVVKRSIKIDNELLIEERNNSKVVILSVARLVWEKGYIYALEAMAILKEEGFNFEYRIAGVGSDYNLLKYHVRRLSLEKEVVFLGELGRSDVKNQLLSADIYCQPSLEEALSLSIIEASSMGLPIVSSLTGGIPEVVIDKQTGFLSTPCDYLQLAENLKLLLKNKRLRRRMGENAKVHIQKEFSREHEIEQWMKLYSAICENE